jgi:hypothetical protein
MHDGQLVGRGYSGADPDPKQVGEAGEGKNDPADQGVKNVGPIPRGRYRIGLPHFHKTAGPYTMRLHPVPGTELFGRDGFLVHGDSASAPGTASHGCVVLPRVDRMRIGESGDEDLEVVI